ncbi:MAG: AAA family ATPase [Fibrobacterota bacterium]|nr:AAA family ATPase [Fibrobacterota bacterium]QQS05813.1 MAG: AAA family ATPase [Fibrobacterota bacterium]
MASLAPLPVGIQDFAQLRERGFAYVDKTQLVHQLVSGNTAVFLSRPRRFGKSLLVSVLKELYEGNEALFRGLWIHDRWDWTKRHPVVRISFGSGKFQRRGDMRERQLFEVDNEARRLGVELRGSSPDLRFAELLHELSMRGPRPVVLIDEYDKPILQNLEGMGVGRSRIETGGDASLLSTNGGAEPLQASEEELSILEDNRQDLRAFYSCLKDASPEFLLLTGVSRLAKASVFSELNHLKDITWVEEYATLCGITQEELEGCFADHLEEMAVRRKLTVPALLDRLRNDYNGFRFAAESPTVYNPFSTCRCLADRDFGAYWTETGTPEFLVRLMRSCNVELADVEGVMLPTSALSTLDPDRPDVLPLLLQTGYLTIAGWEDGSYRLGFPNKEVRTAFVEHLLQVIHDKRVREVAPRAQALACALAEGDLEEFFEVMGKVFQGIAYQLDDAHEKRYHGLFQALCILAFSPPGVVLAEVPNALGRCDLVLDMPDATWIFEFKRDTDTEKALRQIARKRYATSWEGQLLSDGSPKPVRTVAVTFGAEVRNIVAWDVR